MTDERMMRLSIYTDEGAFYGDRRLYEVVATRAREAGLAGATVIVALVGFGRSSHVHRRHVLEGDQSVVIEVIDQEFALRAFARSLADLTDIGLSTLEPVEVLIFGSSHAARA